MFRHLIFVRLALGIALVLVALPAQAQVVRGTARERAGGVPVPGVLVTLEPADGASLSGALADRSVLTDAQGAYALRAPSPGRYRVSAKRIGVQRVLTEPFTLSDGETRQLDLELDATVHTLEEVIVASEVLCVLYPDQRRVVAALWDEIRAALTATTISVRDSLVAGRVSRYALLLEPTSLKVVREARAEAEGLIHRPFASPSGDSLSLNGYWGPIAGDTLAFYGPDTEVLVSDAFRRDHCFSVVRDRRDRAGLTGLAFEPSPNHRTPDIKGTLWVDSRTAELRLVEFSYTNLPRIEHIERVGGEVHFARLPNGAWIVRRWFIRMPRFGYASFRVESKETWSAQGFQLPKVNEILEEGGDVTGEFLRGERSARLVVSGLVQDSTGAAFAGAKVRVLGTEVVADADSAGQFRLAGILPGFYVLVAEHPDYARYGIPAAETDLVVDTASAAGASLRAFGTDALVTRMCEGRGIAEDRMAVRLVLVDSVSGAPVADTPVRMTWQEYEGGTAGAIGVRRPRAMRVDGTTDAGGGVTLCGVPAGASIRVGFPRGESQLLRPTPVRLPQGRVATQRVQIRRPG